MLSLGIAFFLASFLSFLSYLSYYPRVDPKSPKFTSDTVLILGSRGFLTRLWSWWKKSMENSKTGNFSFWLGKYHVIALSGEAARKMYLDNRDLDFVLGNVYLLGIGPDYPRWFRGNKYPIHEILTPDFHNGRSYLQKRLVDALRTEQLANRLQRVTSDVSRSMNAIGASGITNPFTLCYPIVVSQSCRIVCSDEISDDPVLRERCLSYCLILQSTSSRHTLCTPWLPSLSFMKRRYARYGLNSIMTPLVNRRMMPGAPRVDDALQNLIDNGDRKEYIIEFLNSILFITIANAGALAGALILILAHHSEWQEKIYAEIQAAAEAYSTNKEASLVEQLDTIPLEAWESSFPTIEICAREAIRMYTAFPMFRLNLSPNSIPIPGTDEVIPANSFASYNTTDVHYNPELYPNPTMFDPDRYREGREEFKKQTYGFVGWGHGRHPCMGMRWAKLQMNINLAYAFAKFKWSACDANGQPLRPTGPNLHHLENPSAALPQGIYCKYIPREE
ncbi:cytochrome P450 [Stipitochalara longipes BDJ]|nr:cytochrome P450 [Stipitochalara longipes BDJ]